MKVCLQSLSDKPNLVFRKSKVTGKSLEALLTSRVPIPKIKEEALFGIFPVLESLETGRRTPKRLYIKDSLRERQQDDSRVSRILQLAAEKNVSVNRITQAQLDRITDFQLHNGICLDTSPLPLSTVKDCRLTVYLDGVLDPGNIGAITRSCLFFGVEQIVYCRGRGPTKITPSMSKASCGAIERIGIVQLEKDEELFSKCPDSLVIGTSDPQSAFRYGKHLVDLKKLPCLENKMLILVLGDEHEGISMNLMRRCGLLTTIQGAANGRGHVTSLNVSVVAGIILQEISRKMRL